MVPRIHTARDKGLYLSDSEGKIREVPVLTYEDVHEAMCLRRWANVYSFLDLPTMEAWEEWLIETHKKILEAIRLGRNSKPAFHASFFHVGLGFSPDLITNVILIRPEEVDSETWEVSSRNIATYLNYLV